MNFVDDIVKDMDDNPCNWKATSMTGIKNEKIKVEISDLGNGYFNGPRLLHINVSVADLNINGVEIKTNFRERGRIERAYVRWLAKIRLDDVV